MRIYNPDFSVNLLNHILWQYDQAKNLKSLLTQKSAWINENLADFWANWYTDVFDLNTANEFGLAVWGRILNVNRQIKTNQNQVYNLSCEQYRLILKGQLQVFRMKGTVNEINLWLKTVFGQYGRAYVLDNLDMTTAYIFEFLPTEEIHFLLNNVDFLPRPAGVGYEIRILPHIYLGFKGSERETFNNGILYQ